MDVIRQIYLLLICQGFYLGSLCQRWTFPSRITALIGSCVEIPCTYHPAKTSRTSGTVWYSYYSGREILNTERSSSVMEEYKGRTSLVPGENSCTLRIDPVRREDGDKYYYPGIAEDKAIHAYNKQSKTLYLDVTAKVKFQFSVSEVMTEGEATSIRCSVDHTCRSTPPSLEWNKPGQVQRRSVEISEGTWREDSELTYIPSYVDDGTPVQCTATYADDAFTETLRKLNINYTPKNVTVTVIRVDEVMEGSDVTLQCNSFSKSDVYEYEWYKGKTKLPDRGREITVRNVTRDMEPYSCAARNHVGRGESAPIQIPVPYAATGVHITVQHKRKFTKLICDFISSRPDVTHYIWMKDGSVVENEEEKTLTILNNEEGYGQYLCIASNKVGNSSSEEIHHTGIIMDLPLILGTVAGVFVLLFLILLIYIYLRRNKKSPLPASPIHETTSNRILYDNTMTMNEYQYGNIQSIRHAQPPSMGSEPSVDVKVEEDCAIYSNSGFMEPSNEVEYSVISHGYNRQVQQTSSAANHAEDVEYATLRR